MKKFNEPIRYLIVGLICQFTDFILTIILFSLGSSLFFSNFLGYITGSIFSYIGHSKYTFKKRSNRLFSKKKIIYFVIACLAGILSGYVVLKLLTLVNLNVPLAKFLQLAIIAAVQYFFNSKITFQK